MTFFWVCSNLGRPACSWHPPKRVHNGKKKRSDYPRATCSMNAGRWMNKMNVCPPGLWHASHGSLCWSFREVIISVPEVPQERWNIRKACLLPGVLAKLSCFLHSCCNPYPVPYGNLWGFHSKRQFRVLLFTPETHWLREKETAVFSTWYGLCGCFGGPGCLCYECSFGVYSGNSYLLRYTPDLTALPSARFPVSLIKLSAIVA